MQDVSEPESIHTRRFLVLYLLFLLSFTLAIGVAFSVGEQTAKEGLIILFREGEIILFREGGIKQSR